MLPERGGAGREVLRHVVPGSLGITLLSVCSVQLDWKQLTVETDEDSV